MGANAQTSVPTFTAGEILTAANMNISARTGIPVFADSTARDAAFGGTGEKTLAEGQFAYLENSNTTQFYDGATWQAVATAPGLVLVSTTTIGSAVSSVTVSNAFSSTYDNYRIVISGGAATADININMTLGSTSTGYYRSQNYLTYAGVASTGVLANGTSWQAIGLATTNTIAGVFDLFNPNLAKTTWWAGLTVYASTTGLYGVGGGFLNDTTQYTAFTLTTSSGTITGGTIKVYGYTNS